MTIERARQLLGDEIMDLSDIQVTSLLKHASDLCSALIDIALNDIFINNKPASNQPRHEQNSSYIRSR